MMAQRRALAPETTAAVESIGGPNPIVGFRRADLLDSVRSVATEALRNRRHTAHSLLRLAGATLDIVRGRVVHQPGAKDHRFADCAWSENFLYRLMLQLYLVANAEFDRWLTGTDLCELDRTRARFVLSLVLDAVAPSNLPLAPVALKRLIETGGVSAISGLRQFAEDVRHNGGLPAQVDTSVFEVGGNLATTAGAVVFRNEVLELIQYAPRTEQVYGRPLVITPPQINKYYVFDLSAERSLIRYAVEAGLRVFVISWRNPTAAHRNWDLGTYLYALREALDVVRAIAGSRTVNLTGACSGGITAVALAAWLAARGEHWINALTLFVSVFDTAEDPTLLGIFATEQTLAAAKRRSHASGVLDGRELGRIFSLLRPNDLIWSYWVNNYLLGNKPPAFDVLYWNQDTTRLPAALHGQLIDIYRDNTLARPGGVIVDGTPIDLGKICCEAFVMAGTTDHITPWEACFRSAARLGGHVEFVLSSSGHIQSILNPPGRPNATYFLNLTQSGPAPDGSDWSGLGPKTPGPRPDKWRAGATKVAGSWWPYWMEWLGARSGERRPAPQSLGNGRYAPLEPAPGTYVFE